MKTILSFIVIAFVSAIAYFAAPQANKSNPIAPERVATDKVTKFPYVASVGRCNFVEMAD